MAEETASPSLLHHDKGDITLCQPLPLHLPSPRTRITRPGMGRRPEASLPIPPIPIEFVDVGGTLTPSSLCPPTATPTGISMRARSNVVSGVAVGEGHQRHNIQGPQEPQPPPPPPPQQVLTGQTGGTIMLGGDDLQRCVVVDLQGNVVMQETTAPHTTAAHTAPPPSAPYLVEQPILVQVGAGGSRTQGSGGGGLGNPTEVTHTKTRKDTVENDRNIRVVDRPNGGKKSGV